MAVTNPSIRTPSAIPHVHLSGDICPLCEQPIPHEEKDRIEAKDRERNLAITAQLQEAFARQKAQDDAKAKAELERVKRENEAVIDQLKADAVSKTTAAREEGRLAAEALLTTQLTEAQEARTAAVQESEKFKARIEEVRTEGAQMIEQLKTQSAEKEIAARAEGKAQADAAHALKLAELEADKAQAVEAQTQLNAELENLRIANAAALEQAQKDAAAKEAAARAEGSAAAEAVAREKIEAAEAAKAAAQTQLLAARAEHDTTLAERLAEQRESLEKAGLKTLQDERVAWFGEKQKLEEKLQDVTRQLQNKSADELGEGAELDLFELLKAEFPGDKITRYAKGTPGADTLHEIYQNGKLCGRIVYESKNSSRWLGDYVTKLRQDQTAAEADQAILSTHKLPAAARHVHVQDTVIVCQPARVIVLAQIVRRHIIQMHSLRHSNEERATKTEALYSFITSPRCDQHLEDIKAHTDTLEEIDVSEVKAHQRTWKTRGEVIRKIQRSQGELRSAIDRIIGTEDEDNFDVEDLPDTAAL
jgi:hypothetical protein